TATQNALINTALPIEKKLLTVEITFGVSSRKKTSKYIYGIMNVSDAYLAALDSLVGGTLPLEDPEKIQAISAAVAKYSSHRPREVIEEVDGDGTFDYLLSDLTSWLEGFSSIKTVEYPVDDTAQEPNILQDDAFKIFKKAAGSYLRFQEDAPSASEDFRITYTALHVCTNALCTIPASDEQAVQMLAAANFCQMIAAYYAQTQDSTIQADSVDHKSKASAYAGRARAYNQEYLNHMGIKEGIVGAASVTRDQDVKTSHGLDHMTHQRKWR
ncbi:MAG: hypothetical protein ABFC95_10250, partial [Smithella sp.]